MSRRRHLEYKEAVKAGKPIYFLVRDRLEADFNIWKNNHGVELKLSWVKDAKDHALFEMIKSIQNWSWKTRATGSIHLRQ